MAKDFFFFVLVTLLQKVELLLMLHIIVMETCNRHFVLLTTGQVYGSARCLDARQPVNRKDIFCMFRSCTETDRDKQK